jgi:tetratricopeptide (TPR) repeat protein
MLLGAVPAIAAPSSQAQAAFDRGEKALTANQLEQAAAAYQEAIAAAPGYASAINGLGSVYFKQGKKEEAISQFRAAIAADGNFKLAYFNLGYAARKTGDFTTAAGAYEKYTGLDSADPDGYYGLGESYRQSGQGPKAIYAYELYLAKEKRPSEQKYVDRAKEYIATLKAAAAPAQPQPVAAQPEPVRPQPAPVQPAPAQPQPVAVQPTPAQPQPAHSTLPQPTERPGLVRPGSQPQTVAAAKPAPGELPPGGTAAPSAAARQIADGDQLMREKKYREASFAYQDATNADPANVEALFKLGNTYAVLGYYTQAIERWNRVAQLTPDPAIKKSALENVTKAQAKANSQGGGSPQVQGKAPGAGPVADVNRAQARQYYETAVKQINARDYPAALANLSSSIQLEPTLTVAYVARGSTYIGLRKFPEAAADYQYATKLDTSMASPLYGLAEAYRAMGRNADARAAYERYAESSASDVRPDLQSDARQKADKLR